MDLSHLKLIFWLVLASLVLPFGVSAQTQTSVDWAKQVRNKPSAEPQNYTFTRTNGTTASGNLSSAGSSKTVTITNCPQGVNGSDSNHYIYISGGTGTAESVLITGGTCTSGATSGTLIFTPANTHTGAWTLTSASDGLQEVINDNKYAIALPASLTLHAPVYIPWTGTTTNSYTIMGRGRHTTIITVATNFPTSASGVFIAAQAEPGPTIGAFTLQFTQPDSATIGDYTHWPAAFEFSNVPRFVIKDVNIYRAWDGIKALQNAGGTVIDNVWMSAFHTGIQYDGALDSTRISGFHFWPFGLTSNQTTLFLTDTTSVLGLEVGRADDFKLDRSLFISQKAIRAWAGATGFGTGMQITNTSFDTSSQVKVETGTVFIDNSYFSQGTGSVTDALVIIGGKVSLTNVLFHTDSTTQRAIYAPLANTGTFSTINILGCRFNGSTVDASAVPMIEVTAAASTTTHLSINNNQFTRPAVLFTSPIVKVTNTPGTVRVSFQGNSISDQIGATFLKITTDDYHKIWGNSFVGSVSDYPASKVAGIYQSDTAVTFGSGVDVNITDLVTGSVTTGVLFPSTDFVPPPKTYSDLGSITDGRFYYCSDCGSSAGACSASGTGAMAMRLNGVWRCVQ